MVSCTENMCFFSEKMLNYGKLKNFSTPLESDTWHGQIGNYKVSYPSCVADHFSMVMSGTIKQNFHTINLPSLSQNRF